MADISANLFDEIKESIEGLIYGSVEIYVQDKKVTQITVRNIKKTSAIIKREHSKSHPHDTENKNGHYNNHAERLGLDKEKNKQYIIDKV